VDDLGDLEIIFTPGHTAGCISLLYRPDRALFTGDHLAYSRRLGRLTCFPGFNWYDFELQLQTAAKLVVVDFLHVLPGHGRRWRFVDAGERRAALAEVLAEERAGPR
jgi:glyoxylase-like metal-dependent hydrolase (beta-lactamase superfamily II)